MPIRCLLVVASIMAAPACRGHAQSSSTVPSDIVELLRQIKEADADQHAVSEFDFVFLDAWKAVRREASAAGAMR